MTGSKNERDMGQKETRRNVQMAPSIIETILINLCSP